MLRDSVPYKDLTANHFDRKDNEKLAKRLIKRLEGLGLHVDVQKAA